jgi:Rrf2 family protein
LLSNTAEYALQAVLFLADRGDKRLARVNEIATVLDLPQNYLSKILNELVRGGVLTSSRGRHGGFRLAIAPEELSIQDVVARFDGSRGDRRCLLGRGLCSDEDACRVHHRWKAIADQVTTFFSHTTIAELAEDVPTVGNSQVE